MMGIQWPLALFTLFSAMGGCLFVCIAVNEFTKKTKMDGFTPALIAGILAIVGGLCSVLHLEHVERIMNALSRPTSGIFIEAVLIGCLIVCIAIYLICLRRKVDAGVKVFAVLGAVFGIALSFMAGHSYLMEAVASWNTELLPLGYLLTALPMGITLYWALANYDEKKAAKAGEQPAAEAAAAEPAKVAEAEAGAEAKEAEAAAEPAAVATAAAAVAAEPAKEAAAADDAKKDDAAKPAVKLADRSFDEIMALATLVFGALAFLGVLAYGCVAGAFSGMCTLVVLGSMLFSGVGPIVVGVLGMKQRNDAYVVSAFVSATLGALLFRILMWMMYSTPFGFFGSIG